MSPSHPSSVDDIKAQPPDREPPDGSVIPLSNLSPKSFHEALKSFKRGSAAGWSGLSSDHLLEAISCPNPAIGEFTLGALTRFGKLFIAGTPPEDILPFVFGAKLIGIQKKDGGIRPIAIGEVLRRWAAKAVCKSSRPLWEAFFSPFQFGMGVRYSTEIIAECVKQSRKRITVRSDADDFVLVKVDLANAFNACSRDVMLHIVNTFFPSIAPFVSLCYHHSTSLMFSDHNIASSEGVQQGDPLGGLLFALVLQPLLLHIRDQTQLDLNMWFFDDGTLIGSKHEIVKALRILSDRGPALGLHIQFAKTEIHPCGSNVSDFSMFSCFPNICIKSQDDCISLHKSDDLDILGIPITNPIATLRKILDRLKDSLNLISQLEGPEAYNILRYCLGFQKLNHILRTTPPSTISAELHDADIIIRGALEKLVGASLTNVQWIQASLGMRKMPGLGIRAPSHIAMAAYVGSQLAIKETVSHLLGSYVNPDFDACLRVFESAGIVITEPDKAQQTLSNKLDEIRYKLLLDSPPPHLPDNNHEHDVLKHRARLLACSDTHSADFLKVVPNELLGTRLTHTEFSVAVRLRLGIAVLDANTICLGCNRRLTSDTLGHHATACVAGGHVIARHNAIRDCIFQAAVSAGLNPRLEAPNLLSHSSRKPADVFIPNWSLGRGLALDVCVSSSLQKSVINEAARDAGAAAKKGFASKMKKFWDENKDDNTLTFLPICVETFGVWHQDSEAFIKTLADKLALRQAISRSRARRQLFQRLSVALHSYTADAVIARYDYLDCAYNGSFLQIAQIASD
jgi:hypothetical protein